VAGGPLTISNPDVMTPLFDAVMVGEADHRFDAIAAAIMGASDRDDALLRLAGIPGMTVPAIHGDTADPPPPERAPAEVLPARTVLVREPNEFGGAFLVETGRGCPRACSFCVMRSGTRKTVFLPPQKIVDAVPDDVRRVGLVSASVSDHPRLAEVLEVLVSRGITVTLSSLRADRASPDVVGLLARGGLKTLTVAADGVSERLREGIDKGIEAADLERCATVAADSGIRAMRVYMMVGLPGETDDDLAEGAMLARRLASIIPVSVSVSPFVPKKFTPLADAPFAGKKDLKRRISMFGRLLHGEVKMRTTSPRIAETEWRLSHAQGDEAYRLVESLAE